MSGVASQTKFAKTVIAEESRTITLQKCARQFINQYTARGYSNEVKENCLKMYVNGLGFRAQGVCAQVASRTHSRPGLLRKLCCGSSARFKALLCARE